MKANVGFFSALWDLFVVATNPGAHYEALYGHVVRDNGRLTAVRVPKYRPHVEICLQRKIATDDVVDGVLVPVVRQGFVRGGKKRFAKFSLTYEGAHDLHVLLGHAVTTLRRRERFLRVISTFDALMRVIHTPEEFAGFTRVMKEDVSTLSQSE